MKKISSPDSNSRYRRWIARKVPFVLGLMSVLFVGSGYSLDLGNRPISGITADIPGALALVPSVEYPTINSQANLGNYSGSTAYAGYFDPEKCYAYGADAEGFAYFSPASKNAAGVHTCTGQWSGNYLNWATTQTIDPFRSALTGGYRIKDEVGLTVLQKARSDSSGGFGDRTINASIASLVAVPSGWQNVKTRINKLGREMWFTDTGSLSTDASNVRTYDPAQSGSTNTMPRNAVYRVFVRVKVCDPVVGLEANCKQYGNNYKPEGLVQEYSEKMRFAIFGYLNDSSDQRDGGVLRARMKFVGPTARYPEIDSYSNPRREWDPTTGVLYKDPDSNADATIGVGNVHSGEQVNTSDSTGSRNSGVINYLNKFEELTDQSAKAIDPVSELYYASIRYFKNLGNVASYSNLTGNDATKKKMADYFPVITSWDDPIRYSCQVNAILGIGDVNTHVDKNLPGAAAYHYREPTTPPEVLADDTVDVVKATKKVLAMEGLPTTISNNWTGRDNSAFIAGLAYDSHTRDLRPDVQDQVNTLGSQTVNTYWADVREATTLYGPSGNQYWLAAKYGGFKVPAGFDPYSAEVTSIPSALWHTTSETLTPTTGDTRAMPRPDNFYVASDAAKMVSSLRAAFAQILKDTTGSAAALGSDSTSLDVGSRVYQAKYVVGDASQWSGELTAFDVNATSGALTEVWSASSKMPIPSDRKVLYSNGNVLAQFSGAVGGLSAAQVDYLRGVRTGEVSNGGAFRNRNSALGDIINSQPVRVGTPDASLFRGASFPGATAYPQFAATHSSRTPVIYVGGNDGMLHAFNAATGVELFAFVPAEAISRLASSGYTSPNYTHAYSVDGLLTVADVYIGSAWKTVLVGTMGRGGKSVFALDVTNPASPSLLWEVADAAIGNVLGQPIVAQVANGSWSVLLGNGPNSASGTAKLVSIDISSGSVSSVDTGVGVDSGLSGVNAWSSTGTGIIDKVYAGDLAGNLWRFSKAVDGSWSSAILFAAGASKPITATPLVARNPRTFQTWVFVGTGRYLTSADPASVAQQTWYGLIDVGSQINAANLSQSRILADTRLGSGLTVRTIEAASTVGSSGWYMNLYQPGERMVVANAFQGLNLVGKTRVPSSSDVCSPSGRSFDMAIDPFTGGRLSSSFFDINGDGVFNQADTLDGVPISGVATNQGSSGSTFVNGQLVSNLDNASTSSIKVNSFSGTMQRVQWRELINE